MLNGSYKFKKGEKIYRIAKHTGLFALTFNEYERDKLIFKHENNASVFIDISDLQYYSLTVDEAKIKHYFNCVQELNDKLNSLDNEKAKVVKKLNDLENSIQELKEKYPEEFI